MGLEIFPHGSNLNSMEPKDFSFMAKWLCLTYGILDLKQLGVGKILKHYVDADQ